MNELHIMLDIIKNGFKVFRTEHLTFKYLKEINCFFPPKKVVINSFLKYGKAKGKRCFSIRQCTLSIVPMKLVLKQFLELPQVFFVISTYIEKCRNSGLIETVIQGDFWKSISFNQNRITFPLVIYFDDLEINNPLGSHKSINKIGAVYCTIPILPKEYCSKLENIFLFQLHNYKDHKTFGNSKMFTCIIKEIIDLQNTGIVINIDGNEKKIFFILTNIIGDNLGLNTIWGYTRSFNASYPCRICTMPNVELKKQINEQVNILRTKENYSQHMVEKTFGVQEECVFNIIPNFHVVQNFSCDPMHDVLQGICRYDMGKILNMLINEENLFDIDVLNQRMSCFSYVSTDTNIPPPLSLECIKTENIILTASEMLCLVKHFNLFIGDLVSNNNKVWKLYLILRKIVCIIMLDSINEDIIDTFQNLYMQYLTLRKKIFKCTHKCKHHNLLHYPRIMRLFGPIKHMSSMRFEAKHKQIKETSKVITSRKNPSYSLALKHQLQFCHRLVLNKELRDDYSHGPALHKLSAITEFSSLKSILPFENCSNYNCYSWVRVNGTRYESDNIVNISYNIFNTLFVTIKYVIISSFSDVFFLYCKVNIVKHCLHLDAFEVSETKEWGLVKQTNLVDYKIYNVYTMSDSKCYISSDFIW
ncbi:uncharacterized protein LOC143366869 [Andrena cerasifolii]|uniref:uncharacterized protein LOC143366869 n=1 Tax=Andrena cerasifolii TaxID=2819439 RepID=UPI0040380704